MALPVYQFDDKYASDTDGFTFNLSAWLGDEDTLAGTPTTSISPSGLTINSVVVSNPLVTVWVSGGTAGVTYTIEIVVSTIKGRGCRVRGAFLVDA